MLQKIHEHIKGWIASLIIGLLCLTFALWGVQYYLNGSSAEGEILAKVGSLRITERQVNQFSRQLQRNVTDGGATLNEQMTLQLKQIALQNLIAEAALSAAAQKLGFVVSPQQVQQVLAATPAFQQDGDFSPQKFQQFLYGMQLTKSEFLNKFRKELLISQAQTGIEQSDFVLPFEVEKYYYLTHQQRDFSYLVVPAKKFTQVKPTQAQIKRYYYNNQSQFEKPEKVVIDYVVLSPAQIAKSVEISLSTVKQYYEAHKISYGKKTFAQMKPEITEQLQRQKAEQMVATISEELSNLTFTNPDSLTPAAQALRQQIKHSDWFDRRGSDEGIAKHPKVVAAAFSDDVLVQGNNSNPVSLEDGRVVVLRISKHQAAQVPPLVSVSSEVARHLADQMQQAKAALLANQLEQQLQSGASPVQLASQNKLTWTIESNVQRDDKQVPEPVLAAAFNLSLAKQKAVTTVALADGDTAVLRLKKIHYLQFDKADEKQQTAFRQQMQKLLSDLSYGLYVNDVKENTDIRLMS